MFIKNTLIKIGKKKTNMTCDPTLTKEHFHFLDFNTCPCKLFLHTYVHGVIQKVVSFNNFLNKLCTKNIHKVSL